LGVAWGKLKEEKSTMNKLNSQIKSLFKVQQENWELARTNFAGLKSVKTKAFNFGYYEVLVQFNPARITSSGAKVDAKTIAERKCFLCAENRPSVQKAIDFGDYEILVNPFPIFPEHFTIPRREHVKQEIKPYFTDMLELAKVMDEYLIFYNGPKCGASAPDHMHFQAGTKDFLPLVNDYNQLKETHVQLLKSTDQSQLLQMKNYGRTVFVIESINSESAQEMFQKIYEHPSSPLATRETNTTKDEPMLNIVCTFDDNQWTIFILPRKAFRPWQYNAEGAQQLLISPATVEMCGIFITPIEAHFDKITKKDIEDILNQVSY
jgi:ATP adenylyltransferase/5',5'''-P-1,P-4-tetraphosphate phosphorylase II